MTRLYISTAEYFALPNASNSAIKEAHKAFIGGKEYDPSLVYRFGSYFDNLITDIEELNSSGLEDNHIQAITGMRKKLLNNDIYKKLFHGQSKQAVFVDEIDFMGFNIKRKCKFDIYNDFFGFGADLKTTAAQTQSQFEGTISHLDYDQQAAWYMDISQTNRFPFFGISKFRPYNVFVFTIKRNDKLYNIGREKYETKLYSWIKINPDIAFNE